jgi:ketosteroid isomerase-like protein
MATPERHIVEKMFQAFQQQNLADAVGTVSEDTLWIHHGSQKLPSMRFEKKAGVRQFFETNFTQMQVDYFQVDRILQDGHTVIAFGKERFTMAGMEGAMAQKWVQVYTVENGLITRMEEFATSVDDKDYGVVA